MGNTITFSYNSRDLVGNLLNLTDSDQNRTSYTYDALNRQLTDINQLGLSLTYAYNAMGNEIIRVDRNGHKTSYLYDALDTNIGGSDLTGSDLTAAILVGVNFENASLRDSSFFKSYERNLSFFKNTTMPDGSLIIEPFEYSC
jgi:YD repeat-containing protein